MSTWYKKGAGNWSDANGWNSLANGSGTDATAPLTSTDDADLNGLAVTLDMDVTQATILASGAAGQLTVSGTRIINGNVTYSGTLTTGIIAVPTGTSLTINGLVTNSSTGYGVVSAGSAVLAVSNPGGTAATNSGGSAGRAIYSNASTGSCTITGNIENSGGSSYGVWHNAGTFSLTGNVAASNGYGLRIAAGTATLTPGASGTFATVTTSNANAAIYLAGGTTTIIGAPTTVFGSIGSIPFQIAGGTVNFTGSHSLGAGLDSVIHLQSGTLNLATASAALTLSNSGRFAILKYGGTITVTAAGGTASILQQSTAAQAAIIGQAADIVAAYNPGGGIAVEDIVDPSWVATGHDNYIGGTAGTYPTTATSQAAQKAMDAAFLNTNKDEIISEDANILAEFGVTGTAVAVDTDALVAAVWARGERTLT